MFEANVATAVVAPAINISVFVDESAGSVKTLCSGTLECYVQRRAALCDGAGQASERQGGAFRQGLRGERLLTWNEAFSAEAGFLACE